MSEERGRPKSWRDRSKLKLRGSESSRRKPRGLSSRGLSSRGSLRSRGRNKEDFLNFKKSNNDLKKLIGKLNSKNRLNFKDRESNRDLLSC